MRFRKLTARKFTAKLNGAALTGFPALLAAVLVLCTSTFSNSAELRPETLAAWDRYIERVDERVKVASNPHGAFLWAEGGLGRVGRIQRGEVLVSQITAARSQPVPHGMIHDWIGTIFVPGATLADVLAVENDYNRYPQWFGPTIVRANLLDRTNGGERFTIRYVASALFVTVVLDAEYEAQYFQVDAARGYAVARSVRIQEIHEYGKPNERKLPTDDGGGYLWRIYSVARFEQKDNGVYIEQEAIGLSRGIPGALRWLVEPAVRRLARDLLERSLRQTRDAVLSNSGK
jgi:hypothetical protein